jgi:hypothetical protein
MYETFATGRGQRTIKGTPISIVDQMQRWFESHAVDGYLIQPPILPASLDEFNSQIIPELQNRGLFRTEYSGQTLRENLGLKRPPSMHAAEMSSPRRTAVQGAVS